MCDSQKGSNHEEKESRHQRTADHLWSLAKENHVSGIDSHPEHTFLSSRDWWRDWWVRKRALNRFSSLAFAFFRVCKNFNSINDEMGHLSQMTTSPSTNAGMVCAGLICQILILQWKYSIKVELQTFVNFSDICSELRKSISLETAKKKKQRKIQEMTKISSL